jgi:hypothetical protein
MSSTQPSANAANGTPWPARLRAETIQALADMLVADFQQHPDARVKTPRGSDPSVEAAQKPERSR